MGQERLPGTDEVIGHYKCGHGRRHTIPSEQVGLFAWKGGYIAYCTCGPEPLEEANEKPHRLGSHVIPIPTDDLTPEAWLKLDEVADGFWSFNPDSVGELQDRSEREARESIREEMRAKAEGVEG